VTVSGGTAPYTSLTVTNFNASTTGLSPGALSASASAGTVTVNGSASGNGTASFTVNVTDSAGLTFSQVCSVGFSRTGDPAPQIDVEQPAGTPLVSGVSAVGMGSSGLGVAVAQTFTIRNVGN